MIRLTHQWVINMHQHPTASLFEYFHNQLFLGGSGVNLHCDSSKIDLIFWRWCNWEWRVGVVWPTGGGGRCREPIRGCYATTRKPLLCRGFYCHDSWYIYILWYQDTSTQDNAKIMTLCKHRPLKASVLSPILIWIVLFGASRWGQPSTYHDI